MKTYLLLLFSILVCFRTEIKAQSIAGGEIYYELTGPKKFKVTAHVYRQCESSTLNNLTGYVYGGTLQVGINFARTSIQKINDTCGNPCENQNNLSNPGFEKHTFEATVDFNNFTYNSFVTNGICFVNFAIKQSGRAFASTHDNGLFYVDAGTNICDSSIVKNHSPIFSMEPKFFAGCNVPFQYSPGPLDTFDYDSMAFSIQPIQEGYQNDINFKTGYSTLVPFTPYCPPTPGKLDCKALPNAKPPRGFYFDNTYFHFIFTPNKCDEKGYINLRISEYRKDPVTKKMVLLGFTSREMLLQVRQVTDNNPPAITPSSGQIPICSDLSVMNITTTDEQFLPKQTKPDSTYIFWDQGYRSGSLMVYINGREKTADLILPGGTSSVQGLQYFTVAAYDKLCNASMVTRTYIGVNYPQVKFIKSYTLDSCNIFRFQLKSPDSSQSYSGSASFYYLPNQYLSSSIRNTDSFTFNSPGKYIVQYAIRNLQNTCTAIALDTIDIQKAFPKGQLNLHDTVVCASYVANLRFSPSVIPGLKSISWYKNDTLVNTTDSQWSGTIYKSSLFKLRLTANNGCKSENQVNISSKTYNADLLGSDPATVCRNSEFSRHPYSYVNSQYPLHYQWKINGKDLNKDTNLLKFTVKENSKVKLRLTDNNHCIIDDSLFVAASDSFGFVLKQSVPEICIDSSLVITASNISGAKPYSISWKINGNDLSIPDTVISRSFNQASGILLTVKDAFGCAVSDSIKVIPLAVPKVSLPAYPGACHGKMVKVIAAFNPDVSPKTYEWKLDGTAIANPDSFYFFQGQKTSLVSLKVSNRLGCSTEASTNLVVYPNPVPRILTDTNYNSKHKIRLGINQAFSSYKWFNGELTGNTVFWASDLGPPGKYTVWCTVTDKNGCIGSDSVDIFTDKRTGLDETGKNRINVFPNPARNELSIDIPFGTELVIFSLDGKIVLGQNLANGLNIIDITELETGMYIMDFAGIRKLLVKQ